MLILIAAAVIPAAVLLVQVYRADRLEKEPMGLLLSLAALGVLSTALAAAAETAGSYILSGFPEEGGPAYRLVFFFGIVGPAEEGFKYLVLRLRTWRHPAFNCRFDGVVYAVFVSLGFALWENLGYVALYGLGAALTRAVTAVPGHASFGVFMGVWYGAAKRRDLAGERTLSRADRRAAVLVPALLHGCYDFIASSDSGALSLLFLVFAAAMFLAAWRTARRLSASDRYL